MGGSSVTLGRLADGRWGKPPLACLLGSAGVLAAAIRLV